MTSNTSDPVINGKQYSFPEWQHHVNSLQRDTTITDEEKAAALIASTFDNATAVRIPSKSFGILFSGGVDSSLIAYLCRKRTDNFICYTVGMEGSQDLAESRKAAALLDLKHKTEVLNLEEVEVLFLETASILGESLDVVNLGVGAVVLASVRLGLKDGIHDFFSGLGSEEIFAGYQRHENSEDINKACWEGLQTTWQRDFVRDSKIAAATNTSFLTPFLDDNLIIYAMTLSGEMKIRYNIKKYILRKAAMKLGLPEAISMRPKKAAQYGSSFDKALARLASVEKLSKRDYVSRLQRTAQQRQKAARTEKH